MSLQGIIESFMGAVFFSFACVVLNWLRIKLFFRPSARLIEAAGLLLGKIRQMEHALPKASGSISPEQIEAVTSQLRWNSRLLDKWRIKADVKAINEIIAEDVETIRIDAYNSYGQFRDTALKSIKKRIQKLEKRLTRIQSAADKRA